MREIPSASIQAVRLGTGSTLIKTSVPKASFAGATVTNTPFVVGQRVRHEIFGEGQILNYEGSGDRARVEVKFVQEGVKWLMLSYARLEAL